MDTRERALEVVYKPENSSLSENVRQHMYAEDNKVDAVISVVGVGAILFFPISSKIFDDVSTIFVLRSL